MLPIAHNIYVDVIVTHSPPPSMVYLFPNNLFLNFKFDYTWKVYSNTQGFKKGPRLRFGSQHQYFLIVDDRSRDRISHIYLWFSMMSTNRMRLRPIFKTLVTHDFHYFLSVERTATPTPILISMTLLGSWHYCAWRRLGASACGLNTTTRGWQEATWPTRETVFHKHW